MIRTIRCKLKTTPTDEITLEETSQVFANACNEILKVALETKTSDALILHDSLYYTLRKKYPLSANLTVRAIRRVSQAFSVFKKRKKKPKLFRLASIDYDARIFTFFEDKETVSLSTVKGRIRVLLDVGEYQRVALKGKTATSAVVVKRGGLWYIHICIEEPDVCPVEGKTMGIDLGIRNTAYTTTGFKAPGYERQQFKEKQEAVRASLQSKGTRNAKRVLRKISGHERRRVRHENHVLSKQVVEEAKRHNIGLIRMEQLSGIRSKTKVWNKHRNRQMAGWSFWQLQQFVFYKAKRVGITVEWVNPAYTSKTCHTCGILGKRKQDIFRCITCGESHADENAAWNIAKGGAVVSRPELTMSSFIH